MNYVLARFEQKLDIREFYFTGAVTARERQEYLVGVDLTKARKYGIPTQELPLLCKRFLEEKPSAEITRSMMFAETNMAEYATQRDAEQKQALLRRRGNFKPGKKTEEASEEEADA